MMHALFDWINSIFNSFLATLWFNKQPNNNSLLSIYIKTNTGGTLNMNIDQQWNIRTVKQLVATELGLSPASLKLILAGRELEDYVPIQECDLGSQTILHVVSRKRITDEPRLLSAAVRDEKLHQNNIATHNRISTSDDGFDNDKTDYMHSYFVYCSSCKRINRGKLRVRCSCCKSGIFTVYSDPECWDDVLVPQKITGLCENGMTACSPAPYYAEFYFKCANNSAHHSPNDTAVPLNLIKSNIKNAPCLACADIRNPIIVFSCEFKHVICLDCFREYCTLKVNERQFVYNSEYGYTIACPVNCPNSWITEIHHFRILSEADYNKYQQFATEEFVLNSGGILCPTSNCGMGILCDSETRRITCSFGCKESFCKNCLNYYHEGACNKCSEIELDNIVSSTNSNCKVTICNFERARWDEASLKTIQLTTKFCPNCRTPTERDGGCMHIVCTRSGCNFHWCWICHEKWTRECMGNHWFG